MKKICGEPDCKLDEYYVFFTCKTCGTDWCKVHIVETKTSTNANAVTAYRKCLKCEGDLSWIPNPVLRKPEGA